MGNVKAEGLRLGRLSGIGHGQHAHEHTRQELRAGVATRKAILVLGMHRSGTSAITRCLNLLGAAVARHVMPPSPANVTGYWEPQLLVEVHDQMLAEAGSRWDDWRAFDVGILPPERRDHFRTRIKRLLADEYGDAPLLVIKDPRICRFAPWYEAILDDLEIAATYVLPHRNPLAVIASLAKRNSMTPGFAGLLWLRHVLDAEKASRGRPRLFLAYETFLPQWREAIDEIARALDIQWPRALDEAADEIQSHLSDDHRHHDASLEQLQHDPRITRWVKDTYRALIQATGTGIDVDAALLDNIREEFEAAAPIFGEAAFPELAVREARLAAVSEELAAAQRQREVEIARLAQQTEAMHGRMEALSHELVETRHEFETSKAELHRVSSQLASKDQQIEQFVRHIEGAQQQWVEQAKVHQDQIERLTAACLGSEERIRAVAAELGAGVSALRKAKAKILKKADEVAAASDGVQACHQHITKLSDQLNALRDSPLWRIGNGISSILHIPRNLTYYFGRRAGLQPVHDVENTSADPHVAEWKMLGHDPQFELKLAGSGRLSPGHYLFTLQVPSGAEDLVAPHLYFDSGEGYREAERVDLRFQKRGDARLDATFSLNKNARTLRFDPSVTPGRFSTVHNRIRLRRLSFLEFYTRAVTRLASRHVKDRTSFVQAVARTIAILRESGIHGLTARLRAAQAANASSQVRYENWIARHDRLREDDLSNLRKQVDQLESKPLISVLMPVYNTSERLLREAIESVRGQIYDNWELCIADDCSTKPHVRKVLEHYAQSDPRIKVVFRETNGHISQASNSAFELASGAWIAMLDHDDVLRPHALAEVALEIERHPDAQLIYSDEDKVDEEGNRYDPCFKPDFSRELFRSQNYLNHLTVHRAANIRAVGGWRVGFEGSQDYDLNLRIFERIDPKDIRHIPKILYHWRAIEGSTALEGSEKDYTFDAGFRALQEHVERTGLPAKVEEAVGTPFYRLRFDIPNPQPLVSLIIPTRDKVELLRGCIENIREKTTYRNYEILIVDNGSEEPQTLAYFKKLQRLPNVRILKYDKPFNYSAINNLAVSQAAGSVIGLINNDIVVITPGWLTEMVSWAIQPDIGCVGAKLYYADETIQHAGVIVGLGGVAGHSHKRFPRNHAGYFYRLKVAQNLSAVTAACLVVRKSVYEEVGGLNDEHLQVAFNDVDFCLRVRDAGYSNVWTPFAELYHLESISRGAEDSPEKAKRFNSEIAYMKKRWDLKDPYYSKHLTLDREDFSLAR